MVRTTHAAAQLVQLGKAEVIGALNDDGIGGRDIDAGFNNCRTDQHVKTLVMEIIHHPFQFAFAHLAVTDGNSRFRYQFSQTIRRFLNIFNIVIQIVNLTAAQDFTQDRLANHQRVIFADKGFYRQTASWRGGDNGQIAHSAHRHIKRTRNRRGGQRQDIDVRAHRLDAFFMTHPEAVFFIDDKQTQVAQLDFILQQLMGADQNIDFTFCRLFEDLRLLFGAAETR